MKAYIYLLTVLTAFC